MADIFDEVSEDLRKDQYKQIWLKYNKFIISFISIFVLSVITFKYLQYYQEHAVEFEKYRKQLHDFTHNLYVNYVNCFINKKAHINDYPHQYKVCMITLHSKYLDNLMPVGKHIHKGVVIKYINELPPQRLMYLINYNFRK